MSSALLGCKTTRNSSAVKVIEGVEDYQSHTAALGLCNGRNGYSVHAITPLQASPVSSAVEKCEGNSSCKEGWGWLASGEANCKVGAPGWIPEKNGCSSTCK